MSIIAEEAPEQPVGRHRLQAGSRLRLPTPGALLAAVAILYCALVLLMTSQSMSLTYDEVVYASQVSRDAPAAEFSAPRAWGMSLLMAPVVAITESPTPLRYYFVALATVLLFVAFRPWLTVFARLGARLRYVPVIGAALFVSLWITMLYGSEGYPNLWLTFALVGGVGYLMRALTAPAPDRGGLLGVAVCFAVASMLRPTDATTVVVPLFVAALVVTPWRRLVTLVALAAGVAVGWGVWVAEAFARFGGPLQRLQRGGEINEMGLTNSIYKNLASLEGPVVLCRPSSACGGVEPVAVLWWVALPVLVVIGLVVAYRAGWLAVALSTAAAASLSAATYLFLIDYAAPRFLLPTYGLLSLLAATGVVWIADRAKQRARLIAVSLLVVGMVGHTAIQLVIVAHAQRRLDSVAASYDRFASFLRDEHVAAPCLIWGGNAVTVAYLLDCRSIPSFSDGADPSKKPEDQEALLQAAERGESVVVRISSAIEPPQFLAGWRRLDIPGSKSFVAYLSPGTTPAK